MSRRTKAIIKASILELVGSAPLQAQDLTILEQMLSGMTVKQLLAHQEFLKEEVEAFKDSVFSRVFPDDPAELKGALVVDGIQQICTDCDPDCEDEADHLQNAELDKLEREAEARMAKEAEEAEARRLASEAEAAEEHRLWAILNKHERPPIPAYEVEMQALYSSPH